MEYKSFALEELKTDAESRIVEGYGSVFGNVDSYGDIVMPGAFAKSLANRKPAMLWQHNSDQPIGVWENIQEDRKGLLLKGPVLDTSVGNDAYKLAKAGAVTGMSIGYTVQKYEIENNVRKLIELDLWEVSLVTFPANDQATITSVKANPKTIREFEDFLREEGKFSREDATTIALRGYKALAAQGEPDAESLSRLNNLFQQFTA